MDINFEFFVKVVFMGIGATLLMDLWRFFLLKTARVSSLDLGLLGRWVGHAFLGKLLHGSIAKSPPVRGEQLLGWLTHYGIGVTFSFLLPIVWGEPWLKTPTLLPALIVGVGTVLAPWCLMQPAMGMGFAASLAPKPYQVRLRNLAIHTVYGFGLYVSAHLLQKLNFFLGMGEG